jgi:hypothetical protein
MKLIREALVVLTLSLIGTMTCAEAQSAQPRTSSWLVDTHIYETIESDIGNPPNVPTPTACRDLCLSEPRCGVWVYVRENRLCILQGKFNDKVFSLENTLKEKLGKAPGFTSGIVSTRTAAKPGIAAAPSRASAPPPPVASEAPSHAQYRYCDGLTIVTTPILAEAIDVARNGAQYRLASRGCVPDQSPLRSDTRGDCVAGYICELEK